MVENKKNKPRVNNKKKTVSKNNTVNIETAEKTESNAELNFPWLSLIKTVDELGLSYEQAEEIIKNATSLQHSNINNDLVKPVVKEPAEDWFYFKNVSGWVHYISDLKVQFSAGECKNLNYLNLIDILSSNDLKQSIARKLIVPLTKEEYDLESQKPFKVVR